MLQLLTKLVVGFFLVTGTLGNSAVTPLWSRGLVFYTLSEALPVPILLQIRNAQQEFHSRTCIRFEERSTQNDYIQIQLGPQCWSETGHVGGEQILNVSTDCMDTASIIRLFMHALGFHNEHSRFDRDDFVTVQWENIRKGYINDFLKVAKDLTDTRQYDFESVMHFSTFAYSKNENLPTLIPKVEGIILEVKSGFSSGDILKIDYYYNDCTDVELTTLTSPQSTTTYINVDDICQDANGYYSNPTDCKSFYQCENGSPILQPCPDGLYFNQDLSVCDWPVNVNCSVN